MARQKDKKGTDTSKLRSNASTYYTEISFKFYRYTRFKYPTTNSIIATQDIRNCSTIQERKIRDFEVG